MIRINLFFIRKIDLFEISVEKKNDLIEQNQGYFRTQSIKISLIQLENPGRFEKNIFLLPCVIIIFVQKKTFGKQF